MKGENLLETAGRFWRKKRPGPTKCGPGPQVWSGEKKLFHAKLDKILDGWMDESFYNPLNYLGLQGPNVSVKETLRLLSGYH